MQGSPANTTVTPCRPGQAQVAGSFPSARHYTDISGARRYFSDQIWNSQAVINLLEHQTWKTLSIHQYRQLQESSTLDILSYV